MTDETTAGLKDALGQSEETVTIADAESAANSNRDKTVDVVIRKLKGKQFVRIFEEIDALVQKGVIRVVDDAGQFVLGAKGILKEFRDESVLLRGGQPVLNMIAIVAGLPQSHVDDLDLLDLAKLLGAGWKVNERFFVRNQTEFKTALGPIWDLIEGLFKQVRDPKSNPDESSPDSSTSSSAEATDPSEK